MTRTVPPLSARLSAVAELVPENSRVVDVGADHAKLSLWLSAHKNASCIATDLNTAPLDRARRRLGESASAVEFRLGDGLKCVEPGETDVIIIAGMGGETMADILDASPWSRHKLCVLQPASRADRLRRFCCERGYAAFFERVVMDAGRWYPVWATKPGEPETLTPDWYFAGKALRSSALCSSALCSSAVHGSAINAGVDSDALAYIDKQIAWLVKVNAALDMELNSRRNPRRAERVELAEYYRQALDGLSKWRANCTIRLES